MCDYVPEAGVTMLLSVLWFVVFVGLLAGADWLTRRRRPSDPPRVPGRRRYTR